MISASSRIVLIKEAMKLEEQRSELQGRLEQLLGRLTAIMGLSYVAAFLLWTPGGLGVREFLLGLLLAPELMGRGDEESVSGRVVLAVLLLRVAWTLAELLAAGALYFIGKEGGRRGGEAKTSPTSPPPAGRGLSTQG